VNKDRENLIRWLSSCMGRVILACPRCIFVGCPETAYLAHVVLEKLGIEHMIKTGPVPTHEGRPVQHIWLEIPGYSLRVETNPSQILGWPIPVHVMPDSYREELYQEGEILDGFPIHPTPEGMAFYDRVSDQVVTCYNKKTKRRR
jgi:hypothetical protein